MRVFVSAMGQRDNLGDTALRRAFLDTLRSYGPLTVFVGDRSDGYIAGLGLTGSDTLVRTSPEWRRALLAGARTGSVYAHNAGEIELQFHYAVRYLRLLPVLALNRIRGGLNLHVGLGVRAATPWKPVVVAVLRLMHLVGWRDEWSLQYMGIGEYTPDWAFDISGPEDSQAVGTPRSRVAISIRYNGAGAGHGLVSAIRSACTRSSLEPVVVAQIKRDEPAAIELAGLLGGTALTWSSEDMHEQEARVRQLYRESEIVISDRLHALAFGATEGAIPMALSDDPRDKAIRTLSSAGIEVTGIDPHHVTELDLLRILHDAPERRRRLVIALSGAKSNLEHVRRRVGQLVDSRR